MIQKMSKKLERYLMHRLATEEWKTVYINDEPTRYQISNYGDLKIDGASVKTYSSNKHDETRSYRMIFLYHNGNSYFRTIHRLVAIAFIPNPENKPQVNHIDGNKSNNHEDNLEWVTQQENMAHAVATGLLNNSGMNNPNNVYTDYQIHTVCKMLEDKKNSLTDIEEKTGVSKDVIFHIRVNDLWKHISSDYEIPKVKLGEVYSEDQIHQVCKLLVDRKKTISDIEKITGVDKSTVADIASKRRWSKISSKYNFPSSFIRKGEDNHNNLHTEAQIRQVCKLLEDSKQSAINISETTGVSINTIHDIMFGKSWKHISSQYKFPEKRNPSRNKPPSIKTQSIMSWVKSGLNSNDIIEKLKVEYDMPDRTKALQCVNDVKRNYNLV